MMTKIIEIETIFIWWSSFWSRVWLKAWKNSYWN